LFDRPKTTVGCSASGRRRRIYLKYYVVVSYVRISLWVLQDTSLLYNDALVTITLQNTDINSKKNIIVLCLMVTLLWYINTVLPEEDPVYYFRNTIKFYNMEEKYSLSV
jgi:hypothetical protein